MRSCFPFCSTGRNVMRSLFEEVEVSRMNSVGTKSLFFSLSWQPLPCCQIVNRQKKCRAKPFSDEGSLIICVCSISSTESFFSMRFQVIVSHMRWYFHSFDVLYCINTEMRDKTPQRCHYRSVNILFLSSRDPAFFPSIERNRTVRDRDDGLAPVDSLPSVSVNDPI